MPVRFQLAARLGTCQRWWTGCLRTGRRSTARAPHAQVRAAQLDPHAVAVRLHAVRRRRRGRARSTLLVAHLPQPRAADEAHRHRRAGRRAWNPNPNPNLSLDLIPNPNPSPNPNPDPKQAVVRGCRRLAELLLGGCHRLSSISTSLISDHLGNTLRRLGLGGLASICDVDLEDVGKVS